MIVYCPDDGTVASNKIIWGGEVECQGGCFGTRCKRGRVEKTWTSLHRFEAADSHKKSDSSPVHKVGIPGSAARTQEEKREDGLSGPSHGVLPGKHRVDHVQFVTQGQSFEKVGIAVLCGDLFERETRDMEGRFSIAVVEIRRRDLDSRRLEASLVAICESWNVGTWLSEAVVCFWRHRNVPNLADSLQSFTTTDRRSEQSEVEYVARSTKVERLNSSARSSPSLDCVNSQVANCNAGLDTAFQKN